MDYSSASNMAAGTFISANMNAVEARFRCLDLAVRSGHPGDLVELAGHLYDFVTGKDVAERVAAALSKADA